MTGVLLVGAAGLVNKTVLIILSLQLHSLIAIPPLAARVAIIEDRDETPICNIPLQIDENF